MGVYDVDTAYKVVRQLKAAGAEKTLLLQSQHRPRPPPD